MGSFRRANGKWVSHLSENHPSAIMLSTCCCNCPISISTVLFYSTVYSIFPDFQGKGFSKDNKSYLYWVKQHHRFTVYLNSDKGEKDAVTPQTTGKALINFCASLVNRRSTPGETEEWIPQCVIRYKLKSKTFITSFSDTNCLRTELRPSINSGKSLNHETQIHWKPVFSTSGAHKSASLKVSRCSRFRSKRQWLL